MPKNEAGNRTGDVSAEAPEGRVYDESYATKGRDSETIPVVKDTERVEDPIDSTTADSDKQLERDDAEAIDQKNALKERTRGKKPGGSYEEPSDEQMGLVE
ncbi:uncharacterized protein F4807DRAFT_442976 [Annulohypoxylon truncatum]|uniref:uncharacterized protein n=1 Tax=Annulohypoxylon truncatum TaxID=327061 RepID=UPI002007CC93|nr:uncharacterized protein F4807DRAFT_442976 [Annulohypoxylon truncatum]KAI1205542.1 hypothetical protein F4807DRAFT_442976 [Annulohypoxylon truncatum]